MSVKFFKEVEILKIEAERGEISLGWVKKQSLES